MNQINYNTKPRPFGHESRSKREFFDRIYALRDEGKSYRQIAALLKGFGVSYGTVQVAMKEREKVKNG